MEIGEVINLKWCIRIYKVSLRKSIRHLFERAKPRCVESSTPVLGQWGVLFWHWETEKYLFYKTIFARGGQKEKSKMMLLNIYNPCCRRTRHLEFLSLRGDVKTSMEEIVDITSSSQRLSTSYAIWSIIYALLYISIK